jgi:hypothetical protein
VGLKLSENSISQKEILSKSGIVLVVIQLFRLLFGGYLIGFDLYFYDDLESAITVFLIYFMIGVFTVFLLIGKKKTGLIGLIILSGFLLIMQFVYLIVFYSQTTIDPSLHDPGKNLLATIGNLLFPFFTLAFAIKVYKEK